MVARYVRDVEVPGSNPGSPTRENQETSTLAGAGLLLLQIGQPISMNLGLPFVDRAIPLTQGRTLPVPVVL